MQVYLKFQLQMSNVLHVYNLLEGGRENWPLEKIDKGFLAMSSLIGTCLRVYLKERSQ